MLPSPLRQLRGGFDDANDFFNRTLNRMISSPVFGDDLPGLGSYPVDIHESDQDIKIEAELPGFDKDEIDVSLDANTLRITAERREPDARERGQEHLRERRFTRVQRSFTLPCRVNEEQVEARLQDGVLHLRLRKQEEARTKRIPIG